MRTNSTSRTPNPEPRTANAEPNVNTNREARTQKRERLRSAFCVALVFCVATSSRAQSSRISQDEMKQWLSYIASDDLQGRQVFTEGLALAGAYIADQLKEWGVRPAGDDGSYFQTVKVLGVHATSNSSVTVTVNGQTKTFKDGEGVTFQRNQGGKADGIRQARVRRLRTLLLAAQVRRLRRTRHEGQGRPLSRAPRAGIYSN